MRLVTLELSLMALLLSSQAVLPVRAEDENSQTKAVLEQYFDSNFETAKKLCDALIAGHPKNLTARYLLGNICVKLNRLNEAEAAYKYCLRGGRDSVEANYAYEALERLYAQRRGGATRAQTGAPAVRPTVGTNRSHDEHLQEETERLQKDAKDNIAVKQRTLDDKLQQAQRGMQEDLAIRTRGRSTGFSRQAYQAQIKADYEDRVERLKKQFEIDKDEINQACQKRIDALKEYGQNTESRSLNK